jgi:predicted transcriptional regulator
MSNITLAVDDEVIKKVRKLAVDRNTSLNALVRESLKQLAAREDRRREEIVAELEASFSKSDARVGERHWSREDLHDR